ncbi:MAG: TSUP family transporter [Haloarculaceae archaeon]
MTLPGLLPAVPASPFGVPLAVFAAVLALLAGVGVVKGTLGFGSGLLSVPIVIQAFPPEFALAALTLPLWLGNVPVLAADGIPWARLRAERWLVAAAAVGTVVGLLALAAVPAAVVSPLVGAYLVVFLIATRYGDRIRRRLPRRGLGPLTGGAGGLIHGAVLSGGPVFISYFHATSPEKDSFATTLTALFFLAMTIRLALLYPMGELSTGAAGLGASFLVPLAVGVYGGTRLRPHVPQRRFEVIVELLLVVVALKLLSDGLALL